MTLYVDYLTFIVLFVIQAMRTSGLTLFIFLLLSVPNSGYAQYWFGVKAGSHTSFNDYLAQEYKDTFNTSNNFNWQAGAMFSYTASKTYSVHAEVYYKKIRRELENTIFTVPAKTFANYHMLSAPFMLRVNFQFGNSPFSMYVNGGVELNYWLAGSGGLSLDEFQEFFSEDELAANDGFPVVYNVVFSEGARNDSNDRWIQDYNRLQYAITGGIGASFELANGSTIVVDGRYVHMHSNFGFNGSPDFTWVNYYENFEYRPHQLAITVGYQLEYNAQLARKGKSTNKESNR